MKQMTGCLLLAIAVSSCASPRPPAGMPYSEIQAEKLTAAVRALEAGDATEAGNILATICEEAPVPGVTDEALFQLALLRLRLGAEKDEPDSARPMLERLREEYPASVWTRQAAALLGLLDSRIALLRANHDLRIRNLSLSSENAELSREGKELLERLERLKSLDVELDQRSRR